MFAMLHGAWPRVTADGIDLAALEADVAAGRAKPAALNEAIAALTAQVLAAQTGAGLALVTDGHVRWADPAGVVLAAIAAKQAGEEGPLVAAWKAAAALVEAGGAVGSAAVAPDALVAQVAQAIPGPYTLARRAVEEALREAADAGEAPPAKARQDEARAEVALAIADALADEIGALAAAGCAVILVEEPEAVRMVNDDAERVLFAATGTRLLAQAGGVHAMLVLTGGNADAIGWRTVFGPPWQSVLVDLIDGPDSWRLVREAPGDRGIIAGAFSMTDTDAADQAPQLVWAAHYAASANGRGFDRVGLANAQPVTGFSAERVQTAITQLAMGARMATMSPADAVEAGLDPKSIADARTMPALANRESRRQAKKDNKVARRSGPEASN